MKLISPPTTSYSLRAPFATRLHVTIGGIKRNNVTLFFKPQNFTQLNHCAKPFGFSCAA